MSYIYILYFFGNVDKWMSRREQKNVADIVVAAQEGHIMVMGGWGYRVVDGWMDRWMDNGANSKRTRTKKKAK
jgi:hypothetical protein